MMIQYLRGEGDTRLAALRRFALSITVFNLAGHTVLGFEQSYAHPLVGVLAACTTELVLERVNSWSTERSPRYRGGLKAFTDFLLPSYIAGLAISMLLYPNQRVAPIVFACVVCASSKHLIRVMVHGRPRHVLNPSNTGIAITLIAFPAVGISPPYHFTENLSGALDWIVPAAVFATGLFLNWKLTGKMPLILAWLGGFAAQAVVRAALTDVSLAGALLPMTGLAFALFTVYMITDPGTTPVRPGAQAAFGLSVAAVYSLLVSVHIVFGLFFALVIVSALRGAGLVLLRVYSEARQPAAQPLAVPGSPVVTQR